MVTKYKKVIPEGEKQKHGYPLTLEINTTGELLYYISHDGDMVTYRYANSLKKGASLTLTSDQLRRLVNTQQVFKNKQP